MCLLFHCCVFEKLRIVAKENTHVHLTAWRVVMSSTGKRHLIFREAKIRGGVCAYLSFLWQTVISLLLLDLRATRSVWVAMKFIIIHLCYKSAIELPFMCTIFTIIIPIKPYSYKWLRTPREKIIFFPLLDYISEVRTITVHKLSTAEHSLLRGGIVSILLQHTHPQVKRSFKVI